MEKPIKSAISDMYHDIKLSQDELESIKKSAHSSTLEETAKNKALPQASIIKSMAAVACTLVLAVGLWFLSPFATQQLNKTDDIVSDVIDNHLLHKTLQYNTSSISEISSKFSYLGFIVSEPKILYAVKKGKLIGARPCFILNIPAAQLRYQENPHLWTTVFQTRYQKDIYGPIPDIQNNQPLITVKRGVRVSLWRDKELLFAVAQAYQ